MNDLKLFATNDEKLTEHQKLKLVKKKLVKSKMHLKLVKRFSEDIQMEFGKDKCA